MQKKPAESLQGKVWLEREQCLYSDCIITGTYRKKKKPSKVLPKKEKKGVLPTT